MEGLTWSFRARLWRAAGWAGMLLGIAGLAAVGLEHVSFGHAHRLWAHVVYHHHVFFGPHEHSSAQSDPDQEAAASQPASQDPEKDDKTPPRKDLTFSAAPVLFQPVPARVPTVSLVEVAPIALARALPLVARPVILPASPRGPPQKGIPRCRA